VSSSFHRCLIQSRCEIAADRPARGTVRRRLTLTDDDKMCRNHLKGCAVATSTPCPSRRRLSAALVVMLSPDRSGRGSPVTPVSREAKTPAKPKINSTHVADSGTKGVGEALGPSGGNLPSSGIMESVSAVAAATLSAGCLRNGLLARGHPEMRRSHPIAKHYFCK